MDLYKKILELDSVYEGEGQHPGGFETNNPNEAIKEIVRRFFPGVNAQIPISENLQLNLGPNLDEISAGGQFDVGGGELSIGGGMRGDEYQLEGEPIFTHLGRSTSRDFDTSPEAQVWKKAGLNWLNKN